LLSRVTENLTRSYGQNFEKTESRTVELTVNEQVWAFADDALVYTVADYDVWEYPVLSGSELVSDTHIMATFPRPHCTPLGCEDIQVTKQQGNLLDSPYLPYHEVLNILSYPPDRSGLRNLLPADATDQQSVFDIPAFSLGGGLVNQITLERSIIENWEDVRSRSQSVLSVNEEKLGGQTGSVDVGFAIEFNGSPLGVGASSSASVGLSGDFELPYFINEFQNEYGSENISTHSMTLQEDLTIQFQFTHLIEEVQEEYPYTISPFVYWSARTNAFVIDFAADPIVEPGNGWDTYYNKPDPSFNLPWRLDSNLVLQQRTKELGVLTATAGLEANLQAKVHNYGLQDTPQPIDVAFYLPSDYVYTLDGQQTIQAAFASDPLNPESVGTFEVPQADAIHQAVVVNDHAHIAAENGLWVFNVARPDVPTQSGFSGLDGTVPALGVDVAGDIAYVAAGEQGIVVVDVSNPAQPQVVGTYTYTDPTPGYVAGAAQRVVATTCRIGTAQQPCVFVAEAPATVDDQQQGGGLRILNVQDPANPVQIGYLNLGQAVNDLTVPGADYAYLAAADGLHVIDIRSANSPQMTGFYATDSAVQDVAVEEDYAYLALGEAGLQTILMSNDRQTLRDESTYTLLYSAEAVAASGGVLYLADAGRGLVILEALNDPAQPREVGYLAGRSTSLALALDSTAQHVGTPQEIGRVQLPPIPSREFRVASVPWTPPTNGSYRIYSVIDPENLLVDEVKESNNTAYNIIDVCPNGRAPELCQEEQQRTLPVVLAPTDLPPIAMDDSITGTITSTLSIDVISNDRDFYGNPLTVSIEEEPTYGTASVVGTAITYTPGDEFPGFDSFTYTVSNGQQTSRPARVTVGSAPAVTTDYTLYLPLIQR
jgi:hypothetical protein